MVAAAAMLSTHDAAEAAFAAAPSAEKMARENAALRGIVEAQGREIAEMRAGGVAVEGARPATTTTSRRSSSPPSTHDAQVGPHGILTNDLELGRNIAGAREAMLGMEGHPGEDLLQGRRHLQQGDPACSNVAEVSWGPLFFGAAACGHFSASLWGSIDHTCHSYMCDNDANGTGLCVFGGFCDAMCGFCAREPEGELSLGINTSVEVTEFDSPNNPNYHNLTVTAGQTYRVRAFPDEPAVRSMLVIVRNPDGKPIRRAVSNSGRSIRDLSAWGPRTPIELQAEVRDTEMGCAGDTHLDIVFTAAVDGVYSVGLSQETDAAFNRAADMSTHEFTMQVRVTPLLFI
jgi:hypothetical protein